MSRADPSSLDEKLLYFGFDSWKKCVSGLTLTVVRFPDLLRVDLCTLCRIVLWEIISNVVLSGNQEHPGWMSE